MSTAAHVLLVEDHAGDVLLVQEALACFEDRVQLHIASDGAEALRLLSDPGFPCPHFVLMDLYTPQLGALDVLAEMREHAAWSLIPVIVYSSSERVGDAVLAHQAGANAYLVKPSELDAFFDVLRTTVRFWSSTVSPLDTSQPK